MKEYRPAKKRIPVSVGESVRIIRELQELSQNQRPSLMEYRNPRSRQLRMTESVWGWNAPRFCHVH